MTSKTQKETVKPTDKLVLTSPSGYKYEITVCDSGNLIVGAIKDVIADDINN